jgi:hypothetical protein
MRRASFAALALSYRCLDGFTYTSRLHADRTARRGGDHRTRSGHCRSEVQRHEGQGERVRLALRASAQEAYFIENSVYADSPTVLKVNTSPGVIVTIVTATSTGWSAKVTHPQSYPLTCAIFSGKVSSPPAPATVEGLVTCE